MCIRDRDYAKSYYVYWLNFPNQIGLLLVVRIEYLIHPHDNHVIYVEYYAVSYTHLDVYKRQGVDPISVTDIKKIITDLRNRGLGVLITDHNVRETLDVCERAYIVGEGKIIATGTPEEVMNDEHVKRVYLGEQFKL